MKGRLSQLMAGVQYEMLFQRRRKGLPLVLVRLITWSWMHRKDG